MASSKVYPSKPVSPQTIKLSIADVYSPKVWVTQCHFWPAKEGSDAVKIYEDLKEGLSRTLSELPGFAGRIGRTSSNPRDLVVEVSEDAHVDVLYEDLSEKGDIPSYATLDAENFPMTGIVVPLSADITLTPVSLGAPMLVAKFSKIKGGYALAYGFNHLLADASTVAEVERLWSLHTADANAGRAQTYNSTTLEEDNAARERLSSPTEGAAAFESAHWKVFPTNMSQLNLPSDAVNKEAALTMLHKAKEAHWAAMNGDVKTPKWCIWKFSPESLAKLKKDATLEDASKWISTMDSLIGLFWSRLSYLKQASTDGHAGTEMIFPINIRTRLSPPLPATFHGNCVDIIAASAPLSTLEEPSRASLQAASQAVRKAVSSWTQGSWESWLTMAHGLPDDEAICPNPLMLLESRNIAFNDYSKSQSHTNNWGEGLGQIARTRYMKPAGSMTGCATGVVVHPRLADGSLEVATTTTDDLREALGKDEVFREYATLEVAFA